MFILFALVFMRMTGAVMFNPVLGRTNIPNAYKGALIFMLTLMLYVAAGGVLQHEPGTMVEFGVMLVQELFVGFVLGFSMELFFMVVRFASSIMDQTMGLSMAQVYDPTTRTQMTVSSGLYYAFLFMLFMAVDGHVHLIGLYFTSARLIPFGKVQFRPELYEMILELFKSNIVRIPVCVSPDSHGAGDGGGCGDSHEDDSSDQRVRSEFSAEDRCGHDDVSVSVQPYGGSGARHFERHVSLYGTTACTDEMT